MGASFSFESSGVSPARAGVQTMVFRFLADQDGQPGTMIPMPNVVCSDIEWSEGAEPGAARFRYKFDEVLGAEGDPSRVEHAYGLDATGARVFRPDDRVVVLRGDGSGGVQCLFDGYAQLPQADLSDRAENVTFTALGTQVRQWDRALRGAYMRDMDAPAGTSDVQTGHPARFNPDGHPNASPENADAYISEGSDQRYPTFFGPIHPATEMNGESPRLWTLGMAFRYILARGCMADDGNVTRWFNILDWSAIDGSLKAIVPKTNGGAVNWPDASTFDLADIIVQDLDVTGEAWPVAAQKLLEPHGFTMLFRLRTGAGGKPVWWLEVYRKDINLPLKYFYLQSPGSTLDPGLNNLWKLRLARDSKAIKNKVVVDTAPTAREASFVLAQLFEPDAADAATVTSRAAFKGDQKRAGTSGYRDYREWGFDEAGEGHWEETGAGWVTTPGDLEPLLNPPLTPEEEASDFVRPDRPFVIRRRKPLGKLVSTGQDATNRRTTALDPELWVSRDYEAGEPKLWDGSGTWHKVPGSAWSLLPGRIGVRITADDLEQIKVGKPDHIGGTAIKGGKINLLKSIADPTEPANPYLFFRLTCAVEDDNGVEAVAGRRAASPLRYEIERRVDARDRFKRTVVSRFSHFHEDPDPDGEDTIVRDDYSAALDYARALRRAHERASFSGTATCPRFTDSYEIGDKVGGIVGRGLSLRTNAGGEQGESDTFPVVVAIRYTLDGDEQGTQLTLSDHRAEPARRRQR